MYTMEILNAGEIEIHHVLVYKEVRSLAQILLTAT
jgi:hypothetical protein